MNAARYVTISPLLFANSTAVCACRTERLITWLLGLCSASYPSGIRSPDSSTNWQPCVRLHKDFDALALTSDDDYESCNTAITPLSSCDLARPRIGLCRVEKCAQCSEHACSHETTTASLIGLEVDVILTQHVNMRPPRPSSVPNASSPLADPLYRRALINVEI